MYIKTYLMTTLFAAPLACGVNLATLTFEVDEAGFFSFAENGANIETVQVISGVGGTDGVASRVTADPGSFAGGGIGDETGPFDLNVAGIMGGAVTEAHFDTITGSLDVNIPVGQQIAIRLEPGNGGYGERAELNITIDGTGAFQAVSFDTSAVTAAQRTAFIDTLNAGSATGFKFVYQISDPSGSVGADFIFDNLAVNADAVPEPSSALLSLVGAFGLLRRRR